MIPAGQYLTGSQAYIIFAADDDASPYEADSWFRDVRIYEAGESNESTSYAYDAQDRRVKRVHDPDGGGSTQPTTEEFVYDGRDLAMTFGTESSATPELEHRYLYGPQVDQVLVDEVFAAGGGTAGQRISDEVLWQLADHQGTIRDVVDTNGKLRKHVEFDSFGRITTDNHYGVSGAPIAPTHAEAVDQLFYYTGQEWDQATQLANYNARWYDPQAGRFLSTDPSGLAGGDANFYRYVGNSPPNFTDPTGLQLFKPTDTLTGFGLGTIDALSIVGSALGSGRFDTGSSFSLVNPINQDYLRQSAFGGPSIADLALSGFSSGPLADYGNLYSSVSIDPFPDGYESKHRAALERKHNPDEYRLEVKAEYPLHELKKGLHGNASEEQKGDTDQI